MTDTDTSSAIRFLDGLRRPDLAALLHNAELTVGTDGYQYIVRVDAPYPFSEAIQSLPQNDQKRLIEAALNRRNRYSSPRDIVVKETGEPITGPETLLPELIIHKCMMNDVALGNKRIADVEDYYAARQARLKETCEELNIAYENEHTGLWDWYNFWKANFTSYAERRTYVQDLFGKPIALASRLITNAVAVVEREPTGWERVDRSLRRARKVQLSARSEEEWQTVGLLCREVIISLAQAVYDKDKHVTDDGVKPSDTDANRMLEAFIGHVVPGASYKEVRSHARASLALALNLQHRRTATRQLALLCLEATSSTVAVIRIFADSNDGTLS